MLDDRVRWQILFLMTLPIPSIELPENLELAVGLSRSELADQVRLMAALKMFELGKISSGKAAELAGLTRVDFFGACSRYGVSLINYPADELEQEIVAELQSPPPKV